MSTPILVCDHLTKCYGAKTVLSDLSLSVEGGRIIGLLGPNGCGKTTLMKLLGGLLTPTSGCIRIAGMSPGVETKKLVSYLPDKNSLSDWMKLCDLIALFNDFFADFDRKKAEEMAARLSLPLKSPLKSMSKGTKEKVQLILTMSRAAKLYLLDEPIGGVDPAARDYILSTILQNYSEDAAVLLSTHLIADIERVLDEAVFLSNGAVYLHASLEEIREQHGKSADAFFREVYKC